MFVGIHLTLFAATMQKYINYLHNTYRQKRWWSSAPSLQGHAFPG